MRGVFGVRWEAQRHTAFFAQLLGHSRVNRHSMLSDYTAVESAVVASLCRRSPKSRLVVADLSGNH